MFGFCRCVAMILLPRIAISSSLRNRVSDSCQQSTTDLELVAGSKTCIDCLEMAALSLTSVFVCMKRVLDQ